MSGTRFGRAAELSKGSKRLNRPLSGSHFGRSTPIKPPIFKSPLDLAIGEESNHPVLFEEDNEPSPEYFDLEPLSPLEGDEVEEQFLAEQKQENSDKNISDETSTPTEADSGEENIYSRSSELNCMYLM